MNWWQKLQRSRVGRLAYWKTISGTSLVIFYSAVFCLFACVGLISLLMQTNQLQAGEIILVVLLSGGFAIGYAAAAIKNKYIYFPLFIAGQALFFAWMGKTYHDAKPLIAPHSEMHSQLLLLGILATVALVAGYSLFISFFSREGIRYFRAQTEVELAAEIHRTLVPAIHKFIGGFEIYGASLPSGQVGGDLVDIAEAQDGWIGYVADVSGHGVSSGVLMAMFKTAVRSRSSADPSSAVLMTEINRTLFPLKTPNMFVTAGFIECRGGEKLSVALAGHPSLLHYCKRSRTVNELGTQSLALGILPAESFVTDPLTYEAGDIFVLLTDGLTEVFDRKGNELGIEPIMSALRQYADQPLEQLFQQLRQVALSFGRQEDDQTLLLVRRAG